MQAKPGKRETRQKTPSLPGKARRLDGVLGAGLETVDFDGGLVHAILDEEGRDLGPLISLKLDNLTHLLVVNKSTVAGEFLGKS